jgi:hypothetical protein
VFKKLYLIFNKNKDPLEELRKSEKKKKDVEEKLRTKIRRANNIREKRDNSFLYVGLCPACGSSVDHSAEVDEFCTIDTHYKCTVCSYEKHLYCDDEDDF